MVFGISERSAAVSIVAVPKPFRGHIGLIQRNALESWKQLGIAKDIILLGGEDGVAEAAAAAGAIHRGVIRRDSFGTPLVDDVIALAEHMASTKWLCYVNADIILMPEFGAAVCQAIDNFDTCLVVSRRWNLNLQEALRFDSGWQDRLRNHAKASAELFSRYGIDVFVFPRGLFHDVPPFSLGRPCWDNWMVTSARKRACSVVDVTTECSVLHQNHAHDGFPSEDAIRRSQQGLRNFWLAGDSYFCLSHTGDATHYIRDGKLMRSDKVTVSVVIPHAGTHAQLRKCLRALSEQSYPRSYIEIIVVENSDTTSAAVVTMEFPFVILTRELKRGPAAARNKGAAIARGEVVAFLDSDCCPAGDWIEKGVDTAVQHDYRCVVACNVKPSSPLDGATGVKWYENLVYHNQKGFVEAVQACITGGMLVPKSVWVKVGAFDEEFSEAACEDWEWSTRASSQGVPIVYSPKAIVTHPVHTTWQQLRAKARRSVRGELLLAWKRRRYRLLGISAQHDVYGRRLRHELAAIKSDKRMRWYVKLAVAAAAFAVCWWSITEARRQLSSPGWTRSGPSQTQATAHRRRKWNPLVTS